MIKITVFHRTNDGRFVYLKWGAYNKKLVNMMSTLTSLRLKLAQP